MVPCYTKDKGNKYVAKPKRAKIVNTLEKARIETGYTQQEVANIVGIQKQQYQRYEYGENEPGATTAIAIAKALNSTVEDLWGE